MDFLNELERAAIISFNSNPVMVEAVKKVLLSTVYHQGVMKPGVQSASMTNWALHIVQEARDGENSDAVIGQRLRASAEGLNFVEAGFMKLREIKAEEKKEKPAHKAL